MWWFLNFSPSCCCSYCCCCASNWCVVWHTFIVIIINFSDSLSLFLSLSQYLELLSVWYRVFVVVVVSFECLQAYNCQPALSLSLAHFLSGWLPSFFLSFSSSFTVLSLSLISHFLSCVVILCFFYNFNFFLHKRK